MTQRPRSDPDFDLFEMCDVEHVDCISFLFKCMGWDNTCTFLKCCCEVGMGQGRVFLEQEEYSNSLTKINNYY